MMDLTGTLYRFRLPLTEPLALAHGVLEYREGLLLRLVDDDCYEGWGEASPLPGFSAESLDDAEACLRAVIQSEDDTGTILAQDWPPSVHVALEGALQSYVGSSIGVVLARALQPDRDPLIQVQALLAGDDEAILRRATALRESGGNGCLVAKLKVGRASTEAEATRVKAVCEALGPDFVLRLDANRAWDLGEAVAFGSALKGLPVAYIEEPLRNPMDLLAFTEQSGFPFALDESLRGARRLPEDILNGAAVHVVKPSLHMRKAGKDNRSQVPWVLSGAFESGVGTAFVAAQAFGIAPDQPAGLDTYSWLAEDVLATRLPLAPGVVNIEDVAEAAQWVDLNKLERIV